MFLQEIWLDEIIKATFALQLKEYIYITNSHANKDEDFLNVKF